MGLLKEERRGAAGEGEAVAGGGAGTGTGGGAWAAALCLLVLAGTWGGVTGVRHLLLPNPPSRPASSRRFLKLSARALLQMLARAGAGLAAPSQQLTRGWRLARLCDLCRWASSSPGQLCSPHTDCARPRPAPVTSRACCFLSTRAALAESENEKERESLAARPRPGTRGRGGRLSSVRRVAWGSAGESSCWPWPTANYGASSNSPMYKLSNCDTR